MNLSDFGGMPLLLSAIAFAGCSPSNDEVETQEAREDQVEDMKEYVSKTPGAKIYMQPKPDPNIVLKLEGMRGKGVFVDRVTGDMLRSQMADRERRIMYYAYSTKDNELVRVFMTQNSAGKHGVLWKVFPIRLWNIEEGKNPTPAIQQARKRATVERLAEFLSSAPGWRDSENGFMIIDAPISEEDPL